VSCGIPLWKGKKVPFFSPPGGPCLSKSSTILRNRSGEGEGHASLRGRANTRRKNSQRLFLLRKESLLPLPAEEKRKKKKTYKGSPVGGEEGKGREKASLETPFSSLGGGNKGKAPSSPLLFGFSGTFLLNERFLFLPKEIEGGDPSFFLK